ncbi:MAG: hypothetical protein HC845_01085 [Akkermansiaceae bacterium]|nr:hypothetical protein [Akkermansiaceae bacterium]
MKKDLSSEELAEIITAAKPGHPVKKWGIGIFIITLLGTTVWYFFLQPEKETGPIYNTEEITRGNLELNVTATGNLAPTNQVTVGSELSGTISAVHVDTNDVIEKEIHSQSWIRLNFHNKPSGIAPPYWLPKRESARQKQRC